jgi:hypothetical protein
MVLVRFFEPDNLVKELKERNITVVRKDFYGKTQPSEGKIPLNWDVTFLVVSAYDSLNNTIYRMDMMVDARPHGEPLDEKTKQRLQEVDKWITEKLKDFKILHGLYEKEVG